MIHFPFKSLVLELCYAPIDPVHPTRFASGLRMEWCNWQQSHPVAEQHHEKRLDWCCAHWSRRGQIVRSILDRTSLVLLSNDLQKDDWNGLTGAQSIDIFLYIVWSYQNDSRRHLWTRRDRWAAHRTIYQMLNCGVFENLLDAGRLPRKPWSAVYP